MLPVQLISIVVGLGAIHLTYLYYKRASFTKKELYFWIFIWLAFIFISVFPGSVEPIVGILGFKRIMDLLMVAAFIIIFALTFHNYILNRKQEKKLNKLVRELALKDLPGEEK